MKDQTPSTAMAAKRNGLEGEVDGRIDTSLSTMPVSERQDIVYRSKEKRY